MPEISVNLLKYGKDLSDMDHVLRENAVDTIKTKMGTLRACVRVCVCVCVCVHTCPRA